MAPHSTVKYWHRSRKTHYVVLTILPLPGFPLSSNHVYRSHLRLLDDIDTLVHLFLSFSSPAPRCTEGQKEKGFTKISPAYSACEANSPFLFFPFTSLYFRFCLRRVAPGLPCAHRKCRGVFFFEPSKLSTCSCSVTLQHIKGVSLTTLYTGPNTLCYTSVH